MSASFHWIAWNSAILWPNACRSFAYFVDSSRARWAIPRACAAIPIRPPSRVAIAIVKPLCRSPNRLSLGIRQPSKPRVTVSLARIPILSSFFRTEKPFASVGTTNAEISCFFGPVRAYTTTILATDAFVANVFVPRKTHSSRSRVAVVRIAARKFLDRNRIAHGVESRAPVLLRHEDAQEPELAHLLGPRMRELLALVE